MVTARRAEKLPEFDPSWTTLYKHAFEASRDGIWDWDIASGRVFFSPQWCRLLGFEPHDVQYHVEFFRQHVHPDDLARVAAAQEDHFAGRAPVKQLEVRLRTKSGDFRWFLDRGLLVERDVSGKPSRMVGTITDITDRKEAEAALNSSLSLMRATLESTADGILVVSSDGKKVKVFNQRFRELSGLPQTALREGGDNEALQRFVDLARDPKPFLEKILHIYTHPDESSCDTLLLRDGRVLERSTFPQRLDGQIVGRVWSFRDVTERRKAEQSQAEALNRLQKIASRLPGVVYQYRLRPDGTCCIPYASEGMRDMFEIDLDELARNGDVTAKIVDKEAFSDSICQSARDMTPWVHEMQVRRNDGSLRWLAGNSLPERESDGSIIWHGFITDVTERKLSEAKLLQSEKRLREAQSISQIGSFHWDLPSNTVEWSNELYRIHEREPGDHVPSFESYMAAIHPDDRDAVQQELHRVIRDKSRFDHQYRLAQSNGQIRWMRARGYALVASNGDAVGLEGTCQDITEQKRAEAATASLEAQLRESQKMEAIGTLAGGIAHDFNNILAAILGNVELALAASRGGDTAVQHSMREIRIATDRARDLVQQILSFSRRQPTHREPISLGSVIEEAARLLMATLPSRLTLDVQYAPDTPCVMADRTQIEQIILNMVTNSMHALGERRGRICIRVDAISRDIELAEHDDAFKQIQARTSGPVVRLIVSDDGPGMSAETRSRVFEPFFTTKPMENGTGLGLSVVHGIVRTHEGAISVRSKLGEGTTFTVYFPPVTAAEASHPLELDSPREPASAHAPINNPVSAESPRILYLDDDRGVLTAIGDLLESSGYRVRCFSSHEEAIATLRNSPTDFDLMVTDYNMPGMHGLEVAQLVREIRETLPIVMTSGYIDTALAADAAASGVRELLAKPFKFFELEASIKRWAARISRQPTSGA